MDQETRLRAVLGAGFVVVIAITLYYRIKSWASKESLDRRQEGLFILATLRPAGLLLWLGVIAYLLNPAWMAWSSLPLPIWIRWGVCFGNRSGMRLSESRDVQPGISCSLFHVAARISKPRGSSSERPTKCSIAAREQRIAIRPNLDDSHRATRADDRRIYTTVGTL